jgi:hypothetical protein
MSVGVDVALAVRGTYSARGGERVVDIEKDDCVCDRALVERRIGNWFGHFHG